MDDCSISHSETTIRHMGRAIRGFTSGRDAVMRLEYLGYPMTEIMALSGAAIATEYLRQIRTGERARIEARRVRAPWAGHSFQWIAQSADHAPGDPVGSGATEFQAILDFVNQTERVDAAQ